MAHKPNYPGKNYSAWSFSSSRTSCPHWLSYAELGNSGYLESTDLFRSVSGSGFELSICVQRTRRKAQGRHLSYFLHCLAVTWFFSVQFQRLWKCNGILYHLFSYCPQFQISLGVGFSLLTVGSPQGSGSWEVSAKYLMEELMVP